MNFAPPPSPASIPPKPEDHPTWVFCRRLHKWAEPARGVTWGGKLGAEIRANVSQEAWLEWQKVEVMVINELRLNFMDPKSQDVLAQHLRQYLGLDQLDSAS